MGIAREVVHEIDHRDANERKAGRERGPLLTSYACECFAGRCGRHIDVKTEELQAVHRHPSRFLVFPGHVDRGIERVVEWHPRYWVVEKPSDVVVEIERRRRA